jgi:adenylate cyclase
LGFAAGLAAESSAPDHDWFVSAAGLCWRGRNLPLDREGRVILRFKGRDGQHRSYGADAVIRSVLRIGAGEEPELDPSVLSNACVLVGLSAPGLMDLRPTTLSRIMPGTEVHATLLDNLLEWDAMRDVPVAWVVAVVLGLAVLAACGGMLARSALQSLGVLVAAVAAPVVLAFVAYGCGYWWPLVATTLASVSAWVAASVVNFATEGRQRLFLKNAFRQYLGADVIEQIIADPSRLRLGGEKRVLTVFFSDIEGFSSISERLSPEALTALLNAYLSAMGDIIKDEGGYVDKYIGDAIVAFWNAPLAQADHAARACRAAARCQRMLTERQAEFAVMAGGPVRTRIGLHTGEVVVGNMGSHARFNYTILGDAANVASRLEGANKAFGTYTMASDETWRLASGVCAGRPLARLRVVGRRAAIDVHELRGLAGDAPAENWEAFADGLRLFGEGRFADAVSAFARQPDDPASRAYAKRCEMLAGAAPQAWDGIWELTGK